MNKSHDDEKLWAEFHDHFIAFAVNDVEKSLEAGLEVGTIILVTVGIECLGGYYTGRDDKNRSQGAKGQPKRERLDFVRFIEDFMPPLYKQYADGIYKYVRNGLAHDYVTNRDDKGGFLFKRDHGEPHLVPSPRDRKLAYLNREDYARDFIVAQKRYFDRVEAEQDLWDKAMRRLKSRKGFLTVRPEDDLVPLGNDEIGKLMAVPPSQSQSNPSRGLSTGVKPSHPSQEHLITPKRSKSKS